MSESSAVALRAHPKCLLTELDDGTGVVLNLDSKFYFTLNTTAVAVYRELAQGEKTAAELVTSLVVKFEVDPAAAAADVSQLLEELSAEGLVERAG
jgi:hypothetical protein